MRIQHFPRIYPIGFLRYFYRNTIHSFSKNVHESCSERSNHYNPNILDISDALFIFKIQYTQIECEEGGRDVNNIRVTMVTLYQPTKQVVHQVVYQVSMRIFHYNIPERGSFLHKNSCLAYSSEQRRQSWLFLLHVFILIILLFFAKLIKHLMTVWVIQYVLTSVLFITLTFEISLLLTNVSGSKRFNLFLLKSFLV